MDSAYVYLFLFVLWLMAFTFLVIKMTVLGVMLGLLFIVLVGLFRSYRRSEQRREQSTSAT